MHRFEKILLWMLRIGIALTLFSPLIYNQNFFFPYIIPRAVFFQFITEILFVITVTLIAFFPQHRPRWNHLTTSVAIYLGIAALTTLTSADPTKSFIGTIERSFGFFHLLHFGMLFLAAIIALKKQLEWNIIFGISLGVSLYAALDFLTPLLKSTLSRPPTVAGNPIFLAAYLMFHLFFAAHFFRQTKQMWIRVVLGILIVVFAAAILSSGVRGAFVGLSASVAFLLVHSAWQSKRFRVALGASLLVLIAGYSLIFMNRDNPVISKNFILSRITNFSLQESTTRARFAMWKMALKGFEERPLVGWGRENYSLVFNTHFDPSFDEAKVSEGWEDRTHNVFLEELVNGGILGFLSYLLVLTAAFFTLSPSGQNKRDPIMLALLIGYIVQNLFGVVNLNEHLPFFLFLSYIGFRNRPHESSPHEHLSHSPKNPFLAVATSLTTFIIVSTTSIFFTFHPALANRHFRNTTDAIALNNFAFFQTHYGQGKAYSKYFPSLQLEGISILISLVIQARIPYQPNNQYTTFSSVIMNDLAQLNKRNPAEQRWIFLFGQLLQDQAVLTRDIKWLQASQNVWNELLAASPNRQIFKNAYAYSHKISELFTAPVPNNPSKK